MFLPQSFWRIDLLQTVILKDIASPAEETVHLLKCLPFKHEAPSSNLNIHVKKQRTVVASSTGGTETTTFSESQSRQLDKSNSHVELGDFQRRTADVDLWHLHVFAQTCRHTLTCTRKQIRTHLLCQSEFCCCPHWPKQTWGGNGLFHLMVDSLPSREVEAGAQGKNWSRGHRPPEEWRSLAWSPRHAFFCNPGPPAPGWHCLRCPETFSINN